MQKVAIIVPAYNEEKRIGKTLESYSSYFEKIRKQKQLDYEILVVINNTTDNTEEIVRQHAKKNKRIRLLNLPGGGKGYAIMEGFKDALKGSNDLIGFVDADMATSPEEYWRIIRYSFNHDGAIANRYMRGSKVFPAITFRRLIVGRAFNFLIRFILFMPFTDTQCGAKVFKRKTIERTIQKLHMSQWAFDVDLLFNLRKNNYKIISVPTVWVDKEYSKINFLRASPLMFLAVVRLRLLNSPFKDFVKIYDKFTDLFKFIR